MSAHVCPDCGKPIERVDSGWWRHVGLNGECWRLSLDGPAADQELDMNDVDLNDTMSFDHVIEVREDGSVIHRADLYAPESYDDGAAGIDFAGAKGWTPLNGYSGQDSYSGPIMHASEYIGGIMARDILDTPGIYVAVVVTDLDDIDGEPSGWAVLRYDG